MKEFYHNYCNYILDGRKLIMTNILTTGYEFEIEIVELTHNMVDIKIKSVYDKSNDNTITHWKTLEDHREWICGTLWELLKHGFISEHESSKPPKSKFIIPSQFNLL